MLTLAFAFLFNDASTKTPNKVVTMGSGAIISAKPNITLSKTTLCTICDSPYLTVAYPLYRLFQGIDSPF